MNGLSLAWRSPLAESSLRLAFGLAVLVHLAWALGTGLSPDEAHYALYGEHLAWSYYDHPPLVGWLQALALVLGGSDVVLRIWPLLMWWATGSLFLAFNDHVFPHVREAKWLGLRVDAWLWLGSALPHLMGLALVPDSLLMPLSLALMLMVWHLADPAQLHRMGLWLGLGALMGLAGLSKYTAVLLAFGVAIGLHLAHGLKLWRSKGWWCSLLTAALMVSVVLIWNAMNDWASFRYQIAHAQGASHWTSWLALRYVLVVWLGVGVIWPWVMWARAREANSALKALAETKVPTAMRGNLNPVRLCLAFALPLLLVLLNASGRGSALPHWAVPSAVALMPWISAVMARGHGPLRAWVRIGLVVQVLGVIMLAGWMVAGGGPAQTEASRARAPGVREGMDAMNPAADLHGWAQAAQQAAQLARQQGLQGLAVTNWSLASRMAWYARPMSVRVVDDHGDQFNIWFGRFAKGDSVLWVDWSQLTHQAPQGPDRFERCTPVDRMDVVHWGRTLSHFHFYRCENWQGP